MNVSGQLHASAVLPLRQKPPDIWMRPGAGTEILQTGKSLTPAGSRTHDSSVFEPASSASRLHTHTHNDREVFHVYKATCLVGAEVGVQAVQAVTLQHT